MIIIRLRIIPKSNEISLLIGNVHVIYIHPSKRTKSIRVAWTEFKFGRFIFEKSFQFLLFLKIKSFLFLMCEISV